ncbi:MAG: group 1 truncated hemoglobin [Pseudomonadota bacterium]
MIATGPTIPQGSLFTKYGGISALRSVIMTFYDDVLDSEVIGHFFDDVDMARLIDHQTKFFAMLLGGPADFSEDRLARAHAHLGLTHTDFDEVRRILAETLTGAGFTPADRDIVMAEVEARRSIIVR